MSQTMPSESPPCPACGGKMTFDTKAEQLAYEGSVTTVWTKGWWCEACGEGVLDAKALQVSERAYLELKAQAGDGASRRPDDSTS